MTDIIQTTKNKTYKYIRSLKQKKMRNANGVFTVEGVKSVTDALDAGMRAELTAMSESYYRNEGREAFNGERVFVVKDELFGGLCDTETPQGIIAVFGMFDRGVFPIKDNGIYVYCDRVSDPGNIGTIIRTADAAGIDGVMLSPGCADMYSPKTVRASMGSFFHIAVKADTDRTELSELGRRGYRIYAGALSEDSLPYTKADFTRPSVIVIGNEANGICDEILSESEHIIIPIYGRAESLNAGVAAAVMMYEAARQRRGI